MGAASSTPPTGVTMPDNVRLESLRNQLGALEEACARASPELDWQDLDMSVLLHSACNALRNETAVLEHNLSSAKTRWRRELFMPPGSTHKIADQRGVQASKAMDVAKSVKARASEREKEKGPDDIKVGELKFTVAFSEEVTLFLFDGSVHRDVVDTTTTLVRTVRTNEMSSDATLAVEKQVDIDEYAWRARTRAKAELDQFSRDLNAENLSVHSDAKTRVVPYS